MLRYLLIVLLYTFLTIGVTKADDSGQCVSSAEAGGTADALTVPMLACFPTTNLLILLATATTTSTTPTLQVIGSNLPAAPIKTADGTDPAVGAIASGTRYAMTYDGTNWYLLNWEAFGTLPTVPFKATGGTTTADLADRFGHILNVVDDFGADPTGAADATSAINLALAQATRGWGVYFPCGTYKYSTLTISTDGIGFGGAPGNCVNLNTSTASGHAITVSGVQVRLHNIVFGSTTPRTGGSYVRLTGAYSGIADYIMNNAFIGVQMEGVNSWVDRGWIFGTVASTGRSIYVTGNQVGTRIGYTWADTGGSQPEAGVYIDSAGDVTIDPGSSFIHQGKGLAVIPGNGQSVASLSTAGPAFFDQNGDTGIWLCPTGTGTIVRTRLVQPWASSSTNNGMIICSGVSGLEVIDLHAVQNGSSGFIATGGTQFSLVGGVLAQNGAFGASIGAGLTNFSIVGAKIGAVSGLSANTSGGIVVAAGASDGYTITGNNFVSQSTPISDGGTGIHKTVFGNPGDTLDYGIYREASSGFLAFSGVQASFSGYKFYTSDGSLKATINNDGSMVLPGLTGAANCTGQPSGNIIATTGTGVLVKCP